MDAVFALQKAVGILALNGDGRRLDARLVAVLIVQDLIGKVMPLRPAGIHPVEHLGPVLGLGAAGAGVEGQNGVVVVIFTGEQRGQPCFLQPALQLGKAGLELLQKFLVIGLLPHLAQGREVLPLCNELLLTADLVLQLLEPLLHLLGALQVVPESVLSRLILQALRLGPGAVQIQGRRELIQLRLQVPQLLLVGVVFDQSHGVSLLLFLRISLAIVLYRRKYIL